MIDVANTERAEPERRDDDPPPDAWHRSFQDVPREHGFEPLRVTGKLPATLEGTMLRNGPGLFSLLGHPYQHWFDGDGLVSAARFAGGKAEGAARLVETPGLAEERALGRAYWGSYGTLPPGRWSPRRALRFVREGGKNPANTAMLAWAGRTFALCEIGKPIEIDPVDLRTIGETDLDGTVPRAFSAHPHRVAESGYVYNIGVRVGRPNVLDVFALRPDGSAGRITEIALDHPTMIHDFAVTARHVVVFVAPLEIGIYRVLFGRVPFADAMTWRPELGTEVIVIPLDAPGSPIRFRMDAFWAWHTANAYEDRGEIVVDVVRHPGFVSSAAWLRGTSRGAPAHEPDGVLHRVRIDPVRRRATEDPIASRTGEFPRVAPSRDARAHRYVYWAEHSSLAVGAAGPPDTLVRIDTSTGDAQSHRFERGHYPSEGVYVPRPGADGETDGWLVTLVYDATRHASYWAVLDAARIADGPIGCAHFDHHVPLGFHGAWVARSGEARA